MRGQSLAAQIHAAIEADTHPRDVLVWNVRGRLDADSGDAVGAAHDRNPLGLGWVSVRPRRPCQSAASVGRSITVVLSSATRGRDVRASLPEATGSRRRTARPPLDRSSSMHPAMARRCSACDDRQPGVAGSTRTSRVGQGNGLSLLANRQRMAPGRLRPLFVGSERGRRGPTRRSLSPQSTSAEGCEVTRLRKVQPGRTRPDLGRYPPCGRPAAPRAPSGPPGRRLDPRRR